MQEDGVSLPEPRHAQYAAHFSSGHRGPLVHPEPDPLWLLARRACGGHGPLEPLGFSVSPGCVVYLHLAEET